MSREPEVLIAAEDFEAMVGEKIPARWEIVAVGGRLFHKVDGAWVEYPDAPVPPEPYAQGDEES